MHRIHLLVMLIFYSVTLPAQDCLSLGCASTYTVTTDGTQPDQPSGAEWGCYNGYPRKVTMWQFFYSDAGGNYTQTFACAADLDWLVYDMGTTYATMNCPVDPTPWTQVGCDLSYNPGGPTGPGLESNVPTTAGHYYAVAVILWEPLTLTFTFGNPQLGGSDLTPANCLTLLPVKLLQFGAVPQANNVLLNWVVSNEKDIARYEIQGSADGAHFQVGGAIAARGTTNYQFTYANTVDAGLQYFRLKIISIDGKISFSNIIRVSTKSVYTLAVVNNPVGSMLNIIGLQNSGSLRVVDVTGSVVFQQAVHSNTLSVDVSSLHAGLYALQYANGNNTEVVKFLKR